MTLSLPTHRITAARSRIAKYIAPVVSARTVFKPATPAKFTASDLAEAEARLAAERLDRVARLNARSQVTLQDGSVIDARWIKRDPLDRLGPSDLLALRAIYVRQTRELRGHLSVLSPVEAATTEAKRMRTALGASNRLRKITTNALARKRVPCFTKLE